MNYFNKYHNYYNSMSMHAVNINIHHKNEKSADIFRAFDEIQAIIYGVTPGMVNTNGALLGSSMVLILGASLEMYW